MSVTVDTKSYMNIAIAGGVVAITKDHFLKVNGYSNQFWGWGGEDDNMWRRIRNAGLKVTRYSEDVDRHVNKFSYLWNSQLFGYHLYRDQSTIWPYHNSEIQIFVIISLHNGSDHFYRRRSRKVNMW